MTRTAAMTLDVYAGLFADNLDQVADRLDQAFTNLNADQMRTTGARSAVTTLSTAAETPLARGVGWSRLGDSNPGPTHYGRVPVVLADDWLSRCKPAAARASPVSCWLDVATRGHDGDTDPERPCA